MPQPRPSPARSVLGSLVLIGVVVAGSAAAFAYTAGWLSPERLTPWKMLEALAPPSGPALGHRRNHAKGICFTGVFESNGNGAAISRASVLAAGQYPALGRFNLGTPNPDATLYPGMYAQLRFSAPDTKPVLRIPGDTVVLGTAGPRVATVGADHIVHFKSIAIGQDLGTEVEVTSGLSSGDMVISNPTDAVRENTVVEVRNR